MCRLLFGKTFGTTIAIAKYAWENPNSLSWWVSPTYKQSEMAQNLVKNLLPDGTFKEYKADLKLVLLEPNGREHSVIEFKSGDNPGNLRGFGVNFFVMDEAARCDHEAFISLMTTVTQTQGRGFFISTPWGRNWFYDVYQKGVKFDDDNQPLYSDENQDPNPEWLSFRMPTWTNPHVTLKAIEELRRNLVEDVFTQEVGAQFLLDSAGVFRGISKVMRGALSGPKPGKQYVMGVDLGRLKDFTVITVMDRVTRNVVHWERFNKLNWDVQYSRIVATARKFRCPAVMDSTGIGDPIVQAIQNAGIKVLPYKISSNQLKQQLIDKLRLAVENEIISIPVVLRLLRREMEAYEYHVSDAGLIKFAAPSGFHDDTVISLALAYWGADIAQWSYNHLSVRGV